MIEIASKNLLVIEGRLEDVIKYLEQFSEDQRLLSDYLKEKVPPEKETEGLSP